MPWIGIVKCCRAPSRSSVFTRSASIEISLEANLVTLDMSNFTSSTDVLYDSEGQHNIGEYRICWGEIVYSSIYFHLIFQSGKRRSPHIAGLAADELSTVFNYCLQAGFI